MMLGLASVKSSATQIDKAAPDYEEELRVVAGGLAGQLPRYLSGLGRRYVGCWGDGATWLGWGFGAASLATMASATIHPMIVHPRKKFTMNTEPRFGTFRTSATIAGNR